MTIYTDSEVRELAKRGGFVSVGSGYAGVVAIPSHAGNPHAQPMRAAVDKCKGLVAPLQDMLNTISQEEKELKRDEDLMDPKLSDEDYAQIARKVNARSERLNEMKDRYEALRVDFRLACANAGNLFMEYLRSECGGYR